MSTNTETLVLIPLAVALAATFVSYIVNWVRKKNSVVNGLELEINRLLQLSAENKEYLERDHYWLRHGEPLKSFPRALKIDTPVFSSLLSEIYTVGVSKASAILEFYSFLNLCEGLRFALFMRVQEYQATGQPLTEFQSELLKARRDRLVAAYTELAKGLPDKVKLRHLRASYQSPSKEKIDDLLNSKENQGES